MLSRQFLDTLLPFFVIGYMIYIGWSFHRVTKRPEYKELLDSGQKINLNLITLWAAWSRKETDPLRSAHKKVAKIGFRYFGALIIGITLLVLFGAIIIFIGDHVLS